MTRTLSRLAGLSLLAAAVCLLPAWAAVAQTTAGPDAFATSVFVGPPGSDPIQIVSGYPGGVYTFTGGHTIVPSEDGISLMQNGLYLIQLEGSLFMDPSDESGSPKAAAMFAIWLNGEPWVNCATPDARDASDISAALSPSPTLTRLLQCKTFFTVRVRGNGGFTDDRGYEFARGDKFQAVFAPNGKPFSDSTLYAIRMEVTRIGK